MLPLLAGSPFGPGCDERVARRRRRRSLLSRLSKSTALAIWTAPLPVLVAIAGLGYLIARSRSDVLKSIAAATLP